MRTRPNQLLIAQAGNRIPNTIYRRYKRIWQILLDQRGNHGRQQSDQNSGTPESYVGIPTTHQELLEAVTTFRDSIFCLLGYTGVGKSTLLRHFFKFQTDNPDIRRAPISADDAGANEQRVLYIPIFMNGRLIQHIPGEEVLVAVSNHFANQISAACTRLFEDSKTKYDEEEFATFIESQQRDLLERDGSQPIGADKIARLNGLRNVYRLGFEIMLLKWLLLKSNIQRVILIVDDVEALSFENQDAICHVIAQSFEWIRTLRGTDKRWITNGIISLRPLTHNMIQKTDWYRALYFDQPIGLSVPADLKELFEKRFQKAFRQFEPELEDDPEKKENWHSALRVFEHVYERLANTHRNFLVRLCNHSIREALLEFEKLLLNKRYFEPDIDMHNPTNLAPNRLNFTEAAAIRALGMGDGKVFPLPGGPVSNILLNQVIPESDLIGLLILLALSQTGRNLPYGLNYLEKPELIALVTAVCCLTPEEQNCLPAILLELKYQRLIELYTSPGTKAGMPDREIVELMPKAEVLWKGLATSSVLTEMFRDDTFAEYQENEAKNLKCTQEFETDAEKIQAAIEFAYKLLSVEQKFVERCVHHGPGISQWSGTFGPICISRIMLTGIERSIQVSGHNRAAFAGLENYTLKLGFLEKCLRRA